MRVLAIVPTLREDPSKTVESINKQSIGEIDVCVVSGCIIRSCEVPWFYYRPDPSESVGLRVAKALNHVLEFYNLASYDYLLRVDSDVVLPKQFLKENLSLKASYVGRAGYAMLLNMRDFLKVFNGRFPVVGAEDSYMSLMLVSKGYSNPSWKVPPILTRLAEKQHSWKYYYVRGQEMLRLGYEPIHMMASYRNVFVVAGYLDALISGLKRYPFYGWVFRYQLRRILTRARPQQDLRIQK